MAASDKALGELHQLVANALSQQVAGVAEPILDAEGQVTDKVRVIPPSPAILAAAITFLKNNNITADAESNSALRELNDKLKARRERTVPQSALDQAAAAYAASVGAGGFVQ